MFIFLFSMLIWKPDFINLEFDPGLTITRIWIKNQSEYLQ